MTKQLVRVGATVLTTLLALVVLWQFRVVIVYLLISLALAATLRPLVNHLVRRGLFVRLGWILLYVLILGGLGLLVFFTGKTAINELQQLVKTLSAQDAWIMPAWLGDSLIQQTLVARLPPPSMLLEAFTGDQGQLLLPALLGFSQGIGGLIAAGLIILFLSIYWSINQIHFERLWLSLLPSGQRKQARGIWRIIEPETGSYIRAQGIHSLLAGLAFGLGFWLIGSPYPALLALVGALASLVPMLGMVIAVISVLLVGLLTSLPVGLFTALYTLMVMIALILWVKPRLFNPKWNNPILTILLMLALAQTFGIIGLVIAPPISVVCQILWRRLVSRRAVAGAAAQISDLKDRQARLREVIEGLKEPPPPLVTSSMTRLALLIEQAEPVLQAARQAEPSGNINTARLLISDIEPPDSTMPQMDNP